MLFEVFHRDELASFGTKSPAESFPQGYTRVGLVDVPELDDVFRVTNHIDRSWTDNPEVIESVKRPRSTSIGDVVVDEKGRVFVCDIIGWEEVKGVHA